MGSVECFILSVGTTNSAISAARQTPVPLRSVVQTSYYYSSFAAKLVLEAIANIYESGAEDRCVLGPRPAEANYM